MNIGSQTLVLPSDPGAPRLRPRVAVTLAIAAAGAAAAAMLAPGRTELAVLAAALVVAELLPVPLPDGSRLSSWHAVVVPLAALGDLPTVVGVAVGARLLVVLVAEGDRIRETAGESAERIVAAVVAHVGFRLVSFVTPGATAVGALGGFVAAAVLALAVDGSWRRFRPRPRVRAAGALPAAAAVGAGGVLMGLAVAGPGAESRMGIWGVPLFGVLVLATRYAFGRLEAIRRAYDQTIEVLSVVPEMGGLVPTGHARKVADLCVDVGRQLGLSVRDVADLERAALLHALGRVTLDDPDVVGRLPTNAEVARATSDMLRGTVDLSRPATLVTGMPVPHRSPVHHVIPLDVRRLAQVLKVVADFVEASGGHRRADRALERLYSAPGYVYDPEVLAALERVVGRDRLAVGA